MSDLQKITGIGPAHSAALAKLGITTLSALAAITEPDKFVDAAVFKAEDLAGWIEQANAIAAQPDSKNQAPPNGNASEQEPETGATRDEQAPAANAGRRPRRAKAKQTRDSGPRRSVLLLVDDKKHGKRGEIASLPSDIANELRREGKARRATLDDFRKVGRA